ncbi:branched-chain amino acid ABC transporter permease [Albimonas pacifica]|uniref:Amino acid/amide ABC transporter membrane protein 2, HAAT family n=1 Tax=Albimonas pacifica TaxID=1114924 RepID=A0A1I3D850_9RHOB|nr:branched-chain amino acid ABC transporter permease [Albimonas pacifica]SFH82882.1 amino acid/amide ABC transporter membrane protein 2, HAAT family [Albimonas pacifica]
MSWLQGPARGPLLYLVMALLLALVGVAQSWNVALAILNMCLVSAVMALGANIAWGYAGLMNVGLMGFAALGGLAVVLAAQPPVPEAWSAGGLRLLGTGAALVASVAAIALVRARLAKGRLRALATVAMVVGAYALVRFLFDPATDAIEAVDPAVTGYLGGLGLPSATGWLLGGLLAAGAAWLIGKVSLGLRSDYFAIATLGISEIVIAVLKNEDWLARGVKNVTGLPRPAPYEVDLQASAAFVERAQAWGLDPAEASGIVVKLCYAALFAAVLGVLLWLAERALNSPWGRMMRAIRDNEVAAEAMGKDVVKRRLQTFILGSAVVGIGGAMMVSFDGQFTPGAYQPLRFTFLIWVMVIVGGSGNNWGSVLGGFLIWFVWIEAEPVGRWLMDAATAWAPEGNAFAAHLQEGAAHMRMIFMGAILLLVLRFAPRGLMPEKVRR